MFSGHLTPMLLSHSSMASLEVPASNRRPSAHSTVSGQRAWRLAALEPIPLLGEVQNETIVFPEKS